MCLVSIKLFIVCTILCATLQTGTSYTTITTHSLFLSHNYSLFCSQPFCRQHLFVILYSEELQTMQLHTRLTEILLTAVCIVCLDFLYTHAFSLQNVRKQKVRVLAFSRTLQRSFVYVHSHTCLSLMLIVGLTTMYFFIALRAMLCDLNAREKKLLITTTHPRSMVCYYR